MVKEKEIIIPKDSVYHTIIREFKIVKIPIKYYEKEEILWKEFYNLFKIYNEKTFDIKKIAKIYFEDKELNVKKIIDKWTLETTKEFDRWFLKQYFLLFLSEVPEFVKTGVSRLHLNEEPLFKNLRKQYFEGEYKYLTKIFNNYDYYNDPQKLFNEIIFKIFDFQDDIKEFLTERFNLLQYFDSELKISENGISILKSKIIETARKDTNIAIKLCCGRFSFEKELFRGWLKFGKISLEKAHELFPDI